MASSYEFYKGKYIIAFYDKNDEQIRYVFDNVRQILKFKDEEINEKNAMKINVLLYRALKSDEHFITFLTGEVMRVYIINKEEEDL